MTGLSGAESALPTLAALREARAKRAAAIKRRATPIGVAVVAFLALSIAKSHPQPGLHGTSLAITLAACVFLASLGALMRVARGELLPLTSTRAVMPRVHILVMASLVASSVTLEWLQSSTAGTAGLYAVVAVAARAYSRRVSAAVFSACFTCFVALTVANYAGWNANRHGLPGFADAVAVIAVYLMSLFSRQIRVQQKQEEILLAELEESRAAELRAAALAERQRLAREMHDVLAHSLSGLVVQLEGARMLAAVAPGDARLPEVIDRAHQLARNGLDEARQAIGTLRDVDDALPGPDRLAELASDFTVDTGIPCRFTLAGEQHELSPVVRLALYRVAQEALTNVRKHARPDEVDVQLEYLPGTVVLTVEDTARRLASVGARAAAPTASGGYGLTGMRERAGLLGGTLEAGPTDTGFRVQLQVPA